MGREDGSLVLAKRLLWERQAQYSLNVSVTDGLHFVYASVSIRVADARGRPSFSNGFAVLRTSCSSIVFRLASYHISMSVSNKYKSHLTRR